jgi:hypothetical protein
MSGGLAYTTTVGTTTAPSLELRYGVPLSLGANAVIPVGTWAVPATFQVTGADGTGHQVTNGGWCVSDGANVTLLAAGVVIPIGRVRYP